MELYLEVGGEKAGNVCESVVDSLMLEGAKYEDNNLQLAEELRSSLPACKLIWRHKSERIEGQDPQRFPFYLNDNRTDKSVIVVQLACEHCDPNVEPHVWVQRSVGFIMQAPV